PVESKVEKGLTDCFTQLTRQGDNRTINVSNSKSAIQNIDKAMIAAQGDPEINARTWPFPFCVSKGWKGHTHPREFPHGQVSQLLERCRTELPPFLAQLEEQDKKDHEAYEAEKAAARAKFDAALALFHGQRAGVFKEHGFPLEASDNTAWRSS